TARRIDAQWVSSVSDSETALPSPLTCSPLRVCASRCCRSCVQPHKPYSHHVPVPRRHPDPCPRVLQRLVLQPRRFQRPGPAAREQPLLVRTHQVHHRLAPERVAMKPHAAVKGEAHPLAAACEFTVRRAFWQVIPPPPAPCAHHAPGAELRAHCRASPHSLRADPDPPRRVVVHVGG